ncbi:MAG: hypothetical protein LCH56_12410 [Proteobacteria bacterium]|nr:hypothetical protein [Pseudomonadota bacterium]
MYALFFEDTGELIATVDRAPQALGLGRLVSREKARGVIGALNRLDGTTQLCWRFVNGRQVAPDAAENGPTPTMDGEA